MKELKIDDEWFQKQQNYKKCISFDQKNFKQDMQDIYEDIKNQIEQMKEQQKFKYRKMILPKLKLLIIHYTLPSEIKKELLLIHLNLVFNNQSLNQSKKQDIIYGLKLLLNYHYDLVIDYKVIHKYLETQFFNNNRNKNLFDNSIQKYGMHYQNLKKVLIKLRRYYSKNNKEIEQLYFRTISNYKTGSSNQANCYLYLFMDFNQTEQTEIYENILKSMLIHSNAFNQSQMFWFIKQLSFNPVVDLSSFYQYIFKQIIILFEQNVPSNFKQMSSFLQMNFQGSIIFFDSHSKLYNTAQIMVNMLKPQDKKDSKQIWEFHDRIFQLVQTFIHPLNQDNRINFIIDFYMFYIQSFYQRVIKENKIQKRINRFEVNQQDQEQRNYDGNDELTDQDQLNDILQENIEEYENEQDNDLIDEDEFINRNRKEDQMHLLQLKNQNRIYDDEVSMNSFHQYAMKALKMFIYYKDFSKTDNIVNIVKILVELDTKKYLDFILENVYMIFEDMEMDKKLVVKVLIGITDKLLDHKNNKEYFHHIVKILNYLMEIIDSSNQALIQNILIFIDNIFNWYQLIDSDDIKEDLEVQTQQVVDEINEVCIEILKKFMKISNYLNFQNKKAKEVQNNKIFFQFLDVFSVFVVNSSNSIQKRIIDIIAQSIYENDVDVFTSILESLISALSQNKHSLKLIDILFDKLIRKQKMNEKRKKEIEDNQFYFLVKDNQQLMEILQNYEFEYMQQNLKDKYLELLKASLTFQGEKIIGEKNKLEIIIVLFIFDKQFKEGFNIISKVVSSMQMVYVIHEQQTQFKGQQFYENMVSQNHQFDVPKVKQISQKEIEYLKQLKSLFFDSILSQIENKIQQENRFDQKYVQDNYEQIIYEINFEISDNKVNFRNLLKCVNIQYKQYVFRSSDFKFPNQSIYQRYKQDFTLEYLDDIKQKYIQTIQDIFMYSMRNKQLNDYKLSKQIQIAIQQSIFNIFVQNQLKIGIKIISQSYIHKLKKQFKELANNSRSYNQKLLFFRFYYKLQYINENILIGSEFNNIKLILSILCYHCDKKLQFRFIHSNIQIQKKNQDSKQFMKYKNEQLEFINQTLKKIKQGQLKTKNDEMQKFIVVLFLNLSFIVQQFNSYKIHKVKSIMQLTDIFTFDSKESTQHIKDGLFNIVFPHFFQKVSKINTYHQFNKEDIGIVISEYSEWAGIDFSSKKQVEFDEQNEFINGLINRINKNDNNQWFSNIIQILMIILHIDSYFQVMNDGNTLTEQSLSTFNSMQQMIIDNCYNEHNYIRQVSRSGLFKIMKYLKRLTFQKKTVNVDLNSKNQVELEYFLQNIHLTDEILKQYNIQRSYIGTNESENMIRILGLRENNPELKKQIEQMLKVIMNNFNDKQKSNEFIKLNCEVDMSSSIENQNEHQIPSIQNLTKIETKLMDLFSSISNKNSNLLNKRIPNSTAYFHLKYMFIFDNTNSIFENTKELIEEYSKEFDTQEKQKYSFKYIEALLRMQQYQSVYNSNNIEQLQNSQQKWAAEVLSHQYINLSNQFQMTLNYSLYLIFSDRDSRQYSSFYQHFVNQTRLKIGQNELKKHKEIGFYKRYICSYNVKTRDLVLQQIQQIQKEILSSEYKYLEQACQFIQLAICEVFGQTYYDHSGSLEIVNKSINQLKYNSSYGFYMENNQIVQQFFDYLKEKLESGSKEEQKNIQYFYIKICQNLQYNSSLIMDSMFNYIRHMIQYTISFNAESIQDQSQIAQLELNIIYIAQCNFQEYQILEILDFINKIPKQEQNYKQSLRQLLFLRFFIFRNTLIIKEKGETIDFIFEYFTHENQKVVDTSLEILSDIMKIFSQDQIQQILKENIDRMQKHNELDKKQKVKSIYVLISILKCHSSDICEWTNKTIEVIFRHQKLNDTITQSVKSFCSQFIKKRRFSLESDIKLSEDINLQLREMANPYSYFA